MSAAAPPPIPVADRATHPFHTYEMIQEIPAAFRETLRRIEETAADRVPRLADRRILAFTGSGTASYAAGLAEWFAASPSGRLGSAFVNPFELTRYPPRIDGSWALVGISHSGVTKTTVDALRFARSRGALTLGVTHFRDRPIASASDVTVLAGNGPDLSRCHTKCYVAGALAGALMALEWRVASGGESRAAVEPVREGLESLPPILERVLRSSDGPCKDLAAAMLGRSSVGIFGAGPNLPTAREAALKLRETSFLGATGMEIEEFLHGSWQSLDAESLVFVVAPEGPAHARALDLAKAAHTVGSHVVVVASEGDRELAGTADTLIELPRVDELLSPFVNIIPLYLFAYRSAVLRGHNPDLLRYLDPAYWSARQIVFPPGTH